MNAEELVKIVGPLVGLLILGLMVWKMFQIEDAGKKITSMIQSRKLIIADLFLVGLSFLEGLVAANMGDDTLGDSYTTRFASHFVLSMVGAYAGFICIKEVIDFIGKLYEKKYSVFYMFFQGLQPLIYFLIAAVMPIFNLIIISKGAESYEILSYLWSTDYTFTQVYGALDDVTARSLLMVGVHILLVTAVALGSIDDVKHPTVDKKSDTKNKPDVKEKSEKPEEKSEKKEKEKPDIQTSIEIIAEATDGETDVINLATLWASALAKTEYKDQLRGRLRNLAGNIKRIDDLLSVKKGDSKAIEDLSLQKNKYKRDAKKFLNDLKK